MTCLTSVQTNKCFIVNQDVGIKQHSLTQFYGHAYMHVLMFSGFFIQKREIHHGDEFYIVYKKGEEEKSKYISY
jgi:hypothetical protein